MHDRYWQMVCALRALTRLDGARPRRRGRTAQLGLETLQVVILAAAFAAIALTAAAIIRSKIVSTANGIQTQ